MDGRIPTLARRYVLVGRMRPVLGRLLYLLDPSLPGTLYALLLVLALYTLSETHHIFPEDM